MGAAHRGGDLGLERLRRRRGFDAQFLLQQPPEEGVLIQRRPIPSQQVEEAHHLAVGLLAERILRRQPTGVVQRRLVGSLALVVQGQPLQQPEIPFAQPLALDEHPVIVVAFEEIAAIEFVGQVQRLCFDDGGVAQAFEQIAEDLHIEPEGERRVSLHRIPLGEEERMGQRRVLDGMAQRPPNLPERLAQPTARGRIRQFSPEETGEAVAGEGPPVVEEEVGKQGASGRAGDAGQCPTFPDEVETAEEVHPQDRHALLRKEGRGIIVFSIA